MLSQKYSRTYHFPFSPDDDRLNHTYWDDIQHIKSLLHTEKPDVENNCLNQFGREPVCYTFYRIQETKVILLYIRCPLS